MTQRSMWKRTRKTSTQTWNAPPKVTFPLLCPVREAEWLSEWKYSLQYSVSGLIEEGCVFTTHVADGPDTVWYVTKHDPVNYAIEFVRVTPGKQVARIGIHLHASDDEKTSAEIDYEFTMPGDASDEQFDQELTTTFIAYMTYWERALNYFLETGRCLMK